MADLLLIKRENENFLEGKEAMATPLDAHKMHIMEHKCVLADPDLRTDPELVRNVLDHIQQHIDYLRNSDPDLLQLIGEQPLAPPGQLPPDGSMPPGPMNPPQGSLQGNPMGGMMQNNQGMVPPGEKIVNEEMIDEMPGMPKPPEPFETLPVTADQMTPA